MSLEDELTIMLRATCEATREHGYADTELLLIAQRLTYLFVTNL